MKNYQETWLHERVISDYEERWGPGQTCAWHPQPREVHEPPWSSVIKIQNLCVSLFLRQFQRRPVEFIPDFFEEIKATGVKDVHRNLWEGSIINTYIKVVPKFASLKKWVVLLSMKEGIFFNDWFWRNSLMESFSLVRTFQNFKRKWKNPQNLGNWL